MDATNKRIKLAGVSWYGGEAPDLVPLGLDHADVHAIAHEVKVLGFNSVRLPWCNQLFESNPVVASALVSANPALVGKTVLEVFDAVVGAIAAEGLVVILDNHRSTGNWCCDTLHGDGLWHTVQYPESSFIADWLGMVRRYQNQPLVAAVDLRNEIRGQLPDDAGSQCQDCDFPAEAGCGCWQPSWGDNNPETDWAAAAERAGNAIQAVNPNLLIIVEGNFYATYFGANYRPLRLDDPKPPGLLAAQLRRLERRGRVVRGLRGVQERDGPELGLHHHREHAVHGAPLGGRVRRQQRVAQHDVGGPSEPHRSQREVVGLHPAVHRGQRPRLGSLVAQRNPGPRLRAHVRRARDVRGPHAGLDDARADAVPHGAPGDASADAVPRRGN